MSVKNEAVTVDLQALPENPAYDEEVGADDHAENQRNLSNAEYEALEEAVMQTARGRTFLREHAHRNRAVAADVVMRALDDCQDHFRRQELKQPTEILSAELQSMSDAISHARRDIAAIRPREGANNRIMAATEDLDAIVTSTERATNEILAAAERIQENCQALRESGGEDGICNDIDEDITNIFLACSFQDLTGQRTTKVVNALQYLEQRVGAMIQIWGSDSLRNAAKDEYTTALAEEDHPEAGLLNGPQREGEGVNQQHIDQLMGGEAAAEDLDLADALNLTDDAVAGASDPAEAIDFDALGDAEVESLAVDRLLDDDADDPTAGIDFDAPGDTPAEALPEDGLMQDSGADPTAGIDFDAPGAPPADDPAPNKTEAVVAAAAEDEDEAEFTGLSEEMNNDDIDAMFDS